MNAAAFAYRLTWSLHGDEATWSYRSTSEPMARTALKALLVATRQVLFGIVLDAPDSLRAALLELEEQHSRWPMLTGYERHLILQAALRLSRAAASTAFERTRPANDIVTDAEESTPWRF